MQTLLKYSYGLDQVESVLCDMDVLERIKRSDTREVWIDTRLGKAPGEEAVHAHSDAGGRVL